MAETASEKRWAHVRGVTVTTVASVLGIVSGLVAAHFITAPDDSVGVLIFAVAVFVQFPLLRVLGIEVETFGAKDYLFIGFMTFCFWFITLAILLTTEATLPI